MLKCFCFPSFTLYLEAIFYSNFRAQRMLAAIVAAMLYGISGYEKDGASDQHVSSARDWPVSFLSRRLGYFKLNDHNRKLRSYLVPLSGKSKRSTNILRN